MKGVKVPVEVYSRVVGYFRPVSQWNNGKRMEFSERSDLKFNKFFKEQKNIPCSSD
ncbi:MAG TPA: anaerobic ribonucleoside-triphosphate reductase [Spirochaetota bacterium]|nr:anaerobic ribonucleoside-triphosphate reductase [Spirochaetota bacterium]HPJ35747.1 anaerobic ribonucleoside-triphosphate reductase [Spirochaetota bacterium]